MSENIEDFKKYIKNKKVGILGLGVSNEPLINYFLSMGANCVWIFDNKSYENIENRLKELGIHLNEKIKISCGDRQFEGIEECDILFKSPSMRPDKPELLKAVEKGVVLTSEMEVFLKYCPAKVFAVTGSDGKTTTTTLIYTMLKEAGYKCWLGGNIGIPLLSKIDEIDKGDLVVLELSSFQLQTINHDFDVSVITNISPNHLDKHKDMDEYIWSKQNVFRNQSENKKLVLNYDNKITNECSKIAKSNVLFFSSNNKVNGVYLDNGYICKNVNGVEEKVINKKDILIPGEHNVENYMTAILATDGYVDNDVIERIAKSFKGVEHRIEFVKEVNKVKYYNDSIASSPSRAVAALKSFGDKVILIAGGYDKQVSFDILGEYIADKVKCLILTEDKTGNTQPKYIAAPKILEAYKKEKIKRNEDIDIPIYNVGTLEEAVKIASEEAKENDIVLMSPGAASFDSFKNFEEKGRLFKNIVNSL